MPKTTSKFWRTRKVYTTAIIIQLDYIILFLMSRLFGKKYFDKRISKLHRRSALRLKKTFLQLEGLFIKIGQLISILSTFLPEEFRKPLEDFQDKAPPRPLIEIRKRIENELNKSPAQLFAHFEEEPLASASIGQVHRARLEDGTEVVVKIQHKHIPEMAEIDLFLFEKVMRMVSFLFRVKGLDHIASQIKQMISEELDYRKEAKSMKQIRDNLQKLDYVRIPKTFPEYCTTYIITSQYYEGVKINNLEKLKEWEIDRTLLAKQLLEMCAQMALVDGLYHADPHPGNLLVTKEGNIVLLDFGAVSTLNPRMKTGLTKFFTAAAKGDTEEIVEALQFMGFVARGKDASRYTERVLEFSQDFIQNEIKMDSLNFKDIQFDMDFSSITRLLEVISIKEMAHSFQIPKDYILFNRMILLTSGISAELDPLLNPLDVIRPYFRDFVLDGQKNIPQFLLDFVKKNLTTILMLPGEIQKVMYKARRGELKVQVGGMEANTRMFFYLVQQLIYTLLIIAGGVLIYFTYQAEQVEIYKPAFGVVGIFVFLWIRAAWKAKKR